MSSSQQIPGRVRAIRAAAGLTQSQFALVLGVSTRTVKGWEHPLLPRGAPTIEHAERIAALLDGAFPMELFVEDGQVEIGIVLRLERKLDLILERLTLETRRS